MAEKRPDPMQTVEELLQVLREDVALRNQSMVAISDQLDTRNKLMQQRVARHTASVSRSMQRRLAAEQQTNKRARWYTGVLAVFAVLIGAVLFYMVFEMARDMNRMEDYMFNMGHAPSDERPARRHERKVAGPSFMHAMARDMQSMHEQMTQMRSDIGAMRVAIIQMDGTIGAMGGDIGSMSRDMGTMNATMGRMQYDTLLLRQGVGSMSSDTRAMGVPFRVMDSFMPW
ncbi:MAG: hypothetical protein EA400_13705 [Chromatiaceae bacterium]|nr:MAG: hypothetical protein EA400_13705 [Chromatiaceae bacterium]